MVYIITAAKVCAILSLVFVIYVIFSDDTPGEESLRVYFLTWFGGFLFFFGVYLFCTNKIARVIILTGIAVVWIYSRIKRNAKEQEEIREHQQQEELEAQKKAEAEIRKKEAEARKKGIKEVARVFNDLVAQRYGNDPLGHLLLDSSHKWDAVGQIGYRDYLKSHKERLEKKRYAPSELTNLMQEVRKLEQEEKELYFYDEELKKCPINEETKSWVENDARITRIEEIIRFSGLFDGVTLSPRRPHDAPYLFAALDQELPISHQLGISLEGWRTRFASLVTTADKKRLPQGFVQYIRWGKIAEAYSYELNQVFSRICKFYLQEYAITKAGLDGEDAVQEVLDMHAGAFFPLYNLRLEFPGKKVDKPISVETDALVLAPNGIFAIETKNFGSSGKYKIIVSSDGNWYQEYPSKDPQKPSAKKTMPNPFEQNDRHIAYLECFINELLGRDMAHWAKVKNVVVVANNTVEMDSQLSANQILTRVGNLYQHLSTSSEQLFTVEELTAIKAALEAKNLPPKKYPLVDYRKELKLTVDNYKHLYQALEDIEKSIKQVVAEHPEFFDLEPVE